MSDIVMFTGTYVDGKTLYKSAGPYRIATEARNLGFECQIIAYLQAFSKEQIHQIIDKFVNVDTKIVCFSTTLWSGPWVNEVSEKVTGIISYVRRCYPKIEIIFGGTSTASFINNYDGDVYFTGYGEHYFIPYLTALRDKTELPAPTRVKDKKRIYDWKETTDTFSFTNSQIIYNKSDLINYGDNITIEVARGCIFKCKFCNYPLTGKKKLDHLKEIEVLREELIRNYEQWGVTDYIFSDDTFNDSTYKLELLNDLFQTLPFKLRFSSYLRHDLIYRFPEQVTLLKDMGLKGANFGIETFHNQAAKLIGKGMDTDKAKELMYSLKDTWGDDVTMTTGIITGIPYEDYDSYQRTMDFMSDPNCPFESFTLNALGLERPDVYSLHYYSTFQLEAEKYGFSWPDPKRSNHWVSSIGPVKNYAEAQEVAKQMTQVCLNAGRLYFGGFSDMSLKNIAHYTKHKTIENWMAVPRKERIKTIGHDVRSAHVTLVQDYYSKLINL